MFRFYKFAIFISLKSQEGVSQISRSSHMVILASHLAIERGEQRLIIKKINRFMLFSSVLRRATRKKCLFCHLDSVYR